jgi:hypothetical protein
MGAGAEPAGHDGWQARAGSSLRSVSEHLWGEVAGPRMLYRGCSSGRQGRVAGGPSRSFTSRARRLAVEEGAVTSVTGPRWSSREGGPGGELLRQGTTAGRRRGRSAELAEPSCGGRCGCHDGRGAGGAGRLGGWRELHRRGTEVRRRCRGGPGPCPVRCWDRAMRVRTVRAGGGCLLRRGIELERGRFASARTGALPSPTTLELERRGLRQRQWGRGRPRDNCEHARGSLRPG